MTLAAMDLLTGHTSEDTAFVVDDYPYGRRVRTQIRYWIETVPGKGDRFVSQTLNPKTGRWNKPKKSTYSPVGIMFRETSTGYVKWTALNDWPKDETLRDYIAHSHLLSDEQRKSLARVAGRHEAFKHVKWTVREGKLTEEEEADQHAAMQSVAKYAAVKAAQTYKGMQG